MDIRSSWFRLVLVLVMLLGIPAAVDSQCAVTMQMTTTFTGTPDLIIITKTLSMAGNCVTAMSNADGCGRAPAASMATMLVASAYTNTMNPYCSWVCNCGSGYTNENIVTDSSDGLPVELMDFSIEG